MDVVVTVPQTFGLHTWIAEGDPAGEDWSGTEWHFYLSYLSGPLPQIEPGERVYIVYGGALRGYAPLVRIDKSQKGYGLVRHGGAVACTIPEYIRGFQGWQYRWWQHEQECLFPDWQNPDAVYASEIHPVIIAGCTSTFLWCEREERRTLVVRATTIGDYAFAFFGLARHISNAHDHYSQWHWVAFQHRDQLPTHSTIPTFAHHHATHAWAGEIARSGEPAKPRTSPWYDTLQGATRSALRWVNSQNLNTTEQSLKRRK